MKYTCDCGEVYSSLAAIESCQINWHGKESPAMRELKNLREQKKECAELLREVDDYLDNRADVDDGIPNVAMKLQQSVESLLAKLEAK